MRGRRIPVSEAKWDLERRPEGFRLCLPMSMPSLNAWSRWHWAQKRDFLNGLTDAVRLLVLEKCPSCTPLGKCEIQVVHYFRVRRRRDQDNACPKFLLDALRRAGLIQDDNAEACAIMPPRFEVDSRAWRTEVEVRSVPDLSAEKAQSMTRSHSEGGFLALLTPSERAVTIDVARGFSTVDIASRLFLSPRTVKRHLVNVYRKARIGGQNARTALVARTWRVAEEDPVLAAELQSDLFERQA